MSSPEAPRIACVDVPALALQLVLRAHPEWAVGPVVIVPDDRPRAPILWANRAARQVRITRGMSFSEAKALSSTLRAEVVPEHELFAAIDAIFDRLLDFSPHIEPALDQPGLFWIDPSGLTTLFGDLEKWARSIVAALHAERLVACVVIGFSRGHVLALARTRSGAFVLSEPEAERVLAAKVALGRLEIPSALLNELALLGIHSVGELLALPGSQLRLRYGAAAARLHDFLSGKHWTPLLPREPIAPLVLELEVEPPDDDHGRLLFGLKSVLQRAVAQLGQEHRAVTALDIELVIERGENHQERIETAAPTLDVMQIIDLVRLRFSGLSLSGKVEHMRVTVEQVRVHARQVALHMHVGKKPRDVEAGGRALARLRASFGPEAVACAKLRDAHLPEARFLLVPMNEVRLPRAVIASVPQLMRRVYTAPMPLPALLGQHRNARDEPDAWLGTHGAAKGMLGPDRIAGGWWAHPVERDYYVVETSTGELLWVYHDKQRRKWLLHGVVD